jgi:acetyl-CoA carboxylase carboxyltransferase component
MGLEGAVKAGFKKELAAIENPEERGGPLQPVGCPTV